MQDLTSNGLCLVLLCIGAVLVFGMMGRMFGGRRGGAGQAAPPGPYSTPGTENPRYNDPNVQSGGSFGGSTFGGGPASGSPLGTMGGASPPAAPTDLAHGAGTGTERPRHDDPNVKSGGSFGG